MSPGNLPVAPECAKTPVETPSGSRPPIRVCHIDSGDLWAGAEVNTTTLLKALARQPGLQMGAILLNEGEMSRRLRGYGIEVKVIPESDHGFFAILGEAARFLRANPVGILHSHRYKEDLLAALLARRCRIPHLVCTRHGAPEPFRGWRHFRHAVTTGLDQWVMRHFADRVVCLSDDLRTSLPRRFSPHKVVTIGTGIDAELVCSALTKTEAKRRLGIAAASWVVGYAGRLVRIKRLDLFLHAAKKMAEADPSVMFVIAGEGPEQAPLRSLADALRLGDRVQFLGFRGHIYDIFRAFDVFSLTSDHEGLPRSLLEALQLGVPVVARRVGGIPEVIRSSATGVLVGSAEPEEFALAWLRLRSHAELRDRMIGAAAEMMHQRFSVERSAREMAALYREVGGD